MAATVSLSLEEAIERARDDEHLRLLAIFHYVLAAFTAMFALLPTLHLVMGIGILTGHLPPGDADARFVGGILVAIALTFITMGLGFAAVLAWTARNLSNRRRHLACLIVAGLCCAIAPFGTVLGVCSLIVLLRPAVKARFAAA
ncbi:hypothetical protein V3391_11650 [Luteimonas sp. SMYT11W]|uniref:Transmembrane protein n=1 Tax=Luteimonas flava TaxID=3115822 RepID=A0ABU7WFV5_9GAMM